MNFDRSLRRARRVLAPDPAPTPHAVAWSFSPAPRIDRMVFLLEQLVCVPPWADRTA